MEVRSGVDHHRTAGFQARRTISPPFDRSVMRFCSYKESSGKVGGPMVVSDVEDLYPSRVSEYPEITPRRDPVIHGDDETCRNGPLDEEYLSRYERDGFLLLPNFFSPSEIEWVLAEVELLKDDPTLRGRPEAIIEPEGDELRSLFAVHKLDRFLGDVTADERFVDIARQLLGSDVYIHQSRINLKPGFAGKEFYWHSDFETWHAEDGMPRMRAVSFSLLLTTNYAYNGPLMLVPGSHRDFIPSIGETPENHYRTSLKRQEFGVPDHDSLTQYVEKGGITSCVGPPGTLVIFECNTLHGSNGNITPFPRSNLFMVYNSIENQVTEPFCGRSPRPDHIAHRGAVEAITPRKTLRELAR